MSRSLIAGLALAPLLATAAAPSVLRPVSWSPTGSQSGAAFGQSIAPAGDVDGDGYGDLLVGAPSHDGAAGVDAGAAFLYRGGANGFAVAPSWTFAGPQAGGGTGGSVASAGDVNRDGYADVVIGTSLFDPGGFAGNDAGRIDLFLGSAGGLPATPSQTIPGQQPGGRVGFALAPAGDVNGDGYADVIVGLPHVFSFFAQDGAAWILHGNPTGVSQSSFSPIGAGGEQLGYAVAGAGDVDADGYDDVVVGAPGVTFGFPAAGAVYLHRGSATGASNSAAGVRYGYCDSCRFGASVAGAGDVDGDGYADVIAGAPGGISLGQRRGYAEVIAGSAGATFSTIRWSSTGGDIGERYGIAVATAGDLDGDDLADFVVGADRTPSPGAPVGRVEVWLGSPTVPAYDGNLSGDAVGDAFGIAVATAGDADGDGLGDLAVGAPGANGAQADDGRVRLWRGGAKKPVLAPSWPLFEGENLALFGHALAGGIDARRVGVDDLFASAPFADAGFTDAGRIHVAGSQWPSPTSFAGPVANGDRLLGKLGASMARAGDLNGDGHEDLLTGSVEYSTGTPYEGAVLAFYGGATGIGPSPSWSWEGPEPYFQAGQDVDAGDFDGDGFSDVLVSSFTSVAPSYSTYDGSARVFRGSLAGPGGTASWTTPPVTGDTWHGFSVAVGDWDADGYDDAAVSAPNASSPEVQEGRVDVYFGGPNGLGVTPTWVLEKNVANAGFGRGLANAGDVDGDGVADIIVGAPYANAVYLYRGSRSRSAPVPNEVRTFRPDVSTITFGWTVAGIGDIDKDGFADFLVGAPQHQAGQVNEGGVWLFRGSRLGGDLVPWWKSETNAGEAWFGSSLAAAGDINQDGWPDFAVGAPYQGSGGAVYLFLGGGGGALHSTIQTIPAPSTVAVPMGGRLAGNAFAPVVVFRSAAGRARGRIELQLGTQNEAWSGGARSFHGPYDSGSPGLYGSLFPVQFAVPGVPPGAAWRWRERSVTSSPHFPHSAWRQPRSFETGQPHFRTGGTNVAVDPASVMRAAVAFAGIEPSPFRGEARIRFRLARAVDDARLDVHDARGRHLRRLAAGPSAAGEHSAVFDGRDSAGRPLPAGVYFVTLEAEGARASRKVVRLP